MLRVYSDTGVDQQGLITLLKELAPWEVSCITSREIIENDWEHNTSVIIFPGGRGVPYHRALRGRGNARIRSFVEKGGGYFGICAGAYYGSARVEFDKDMSLEVIGDRELGFFPGVAKGPAYGPGTFCYHSEKGARAANISCQDTPLKSYYNGGCYFAEAASFSNIRILSEYVDIPDQPAAVIHCTVGQGNVILSGVHIEMGVVHHKAHFSDEMLCELTPYNRVRSDFFSELVRGLVNSSSISAKQI